MREKTSLDLIKRLSEAEGISGHESAVREIFINELSGQGEMSSDGSGSVFCTHGTGSSVMLAGHLDEIGFMVQNITLEGFIQFVGIGGWWPHTLLSQRVSIRTLSGRKITGVIGSKPPHFLPESQRKNVIPIDSMFIDVGADNREQVTREFGIHVGDPITPESSFFSLEHPGRFGGKAFDNRLGMAAVIEAGRILTKNEHPNKLILAGTVQEEVGTRGARTAAAVMKPDCVIVLEAPPADDTPGFTRAESQAGLGKGVQIRFFDPTSIMNPRLARFAVETAESMQIPCQTAVRRTGGTDAGSFHISGQGIPCIVLGVPSRYIHAHNGIFDIKDYHAMVDLAVEMARRLDSDTISSFTKYL